MALEKPGNLGEFFSPTLWPPCFVLVSECLALMHKTAQELAWSQCITCCAHLSSSLCWYQILLVGFRGRAERNMPQSNANKSEQHRDWENILYVDYFRWHAVVMCYDCLLLKGIRAVHSGQSMQLYCRYSQNFRMKMMIVNSVPASWAQRQVWDSQQTVQSLTIRPCHGVMLFRFHCYLNAH